MRLRLKREAAPLQNTQARGHDEKADARLLRAAEKRVHARSHGGAAEFVVLHGSARWWLVVSGEAAVNYTMVKCN